MNKLYFGDNLDVIRRHIKDDSVDLIYLDPPFNSRAVYSVIFNEDGTGSEAQAEAFRDTWSWGPAAAEAYDDILRAGGDLSVLLQALRVTLGQSSMMAYLAMMSVRLIEMHRALKPAGSLYLHCDPTASHYLKLVLDTLFGQSNFRSEIIWKRTSSHNSARRWGPIHDVLLFYTTSEDFTWNRVFTPYDPEYVRKFYKHKDEDGRLYRLSDLTGSGTRNGESGKPWNGFNPTLYGRHWGIPSEVKAQFPDLKLKPHAWLDLFEKEGLVQMTGDGAGWPHVRRYLDRMPGQAIQDIVTDVPPLSKRHAERMGYPTQKPLALLERIIAASSNQDGIVLDPFCGCGTTIEAAALSGRQWIGIDVTHYAVTLIEKRLQRAGAGSGYEVYGRPTDLAGARALAARDKYQFQWWASWLLGAQTYDSKKGGDRGIDANIYFANGPFGLGRIIISVKGGEHLTPSMVRDLAGVVEREKAEMGILITLGKPSRGMEADANAYGFVSKSAHGRLPRVQIATVEDLLDRRLPKLPPLPQPVETPRGRRRRAEKDQLELMLPFAGNGSLQTDDGTIIDPRFYSVAVGIR
jgi:site-specific DNA-methyltransferase (adenine-specific)